MSYSPLQLADAFIKTGELEDALEALNDHLKEAPTDAEALRLRAQVYMQTGALDATLKDLNTIEHHSEDKFTLSVLYERMGKPEQALQAAQQSHDIATDERMKSRALERLLNMMRKNNQLEQALELALENDWVQWAADAAAELNDKRAIDFYTQALERVVRLPVSDAITDNIKARVLIKRAGMYWQLGDLTAAELDYIAAEEIIADDPILPFNRGLIAAHAGREDDAKAFVTKALQKAPARLKTIMAQELHSDDRYKALLPLL